MTKIEMHAITKEIKLNISGKLLVSMQGKEASLHTAAIAHPC